MAWTGPSRTNWIGDDPVYRHDHSPVNYVQNIRVPTLHAYGENDPRVDIDHWKRLKAELDRYHKPYEFVREGDEGHGFHHESARIGFYRHVEDFLARYLAAPGQVNVGPTEVIDLPAKSDALSRSRSHGSPGPWLRIQRVAGPRPVFGAVFFFPVPCAALPFRTGPRGQAKDHWFRGDSRRD